MPLDLAVASQGFAQKITKVGETKKENVDAPTQSVNFKRKTDLANIFNVTETESAKEGGTKLFKTEPLEPVAVQGNANIFSTQVAQSQYKAAEVAHTADLQNYDASKVGAKFGGVI